ncbi:MAG: phospho-N-acetylmuramoyl-pentapeptide-transferase [Desulfovibrio sp.]|jgi:phospho-N-acetylmuramoyl-pentapeptide-transferase|nr:phospho-N-acetylmuramoyl-pentapeptide-transferase [Desulfovibrio sp.]
MFYNLLYPLSAEIRVFNVFRYITFRSVWALLTALIISILIGPWFIRQLKRLKFGQYIQDDVKAHLEKAGTPTMGGLLIAFSLSVSVLLWGDLTNPYVWLSLLVFFGFGTVGFVDDYLKIRRKNNDGISVRAKFLGQAVVACIAMGVLFTLPAYSTHLAVPFFKNFTPDLGLLYLPFAVLVMVGTSNGVNLTDGLDGLAIGPTIVTGMCLAVFIYVAGNVSMAGYLQVPYVPGVGEVTVFCGALVGASIGFLWFNAYPAQVFMGDVGALSLGGVLGFLSVLCKQELILLVVGGLFVVETLSVIMQVGYFKFTGGKRFFRMAPLHHHFEMAGTPESKIIIRFWIMSGILALVGLSILKLR